MVSSSLCSWQQTDRSYSPAKVTQAKLHASTALSRSGRTPRSLSDTNEKILPTGNITLTSTVPTDRSSDQARLMRASREWKTALPRLGLMHPKPPLKKQHHKQLQMQSQWQDVSASASLSRVIIQNHTANNITALMQLLLSDH